MNSMMLLSKKELPVLFFCLGYLPAFTIYSLTKQNYEFVMYGGSVLLIGGWIIWKQPSVRLPLAVLWGLAFWGLLHMAGGNLQLGDGVLYGFQLIPVILRYDQLVHLIGFGTTTLVCHHVLKSYLRTDITQWRSLTLLIVLMGSGVGALNEIVEFIAVKSVPETNVGGYDNTLWDLVFNLIGGVCAVAWLGWRKELPGQVRERTSAANAD
jgi:hypothetical protein